MKIRTHLLGALANGRAAGDTVSDLLRPREDLAAAGAVIVALDLGRCAPRIAPPEVCAVSPHPMENNGKTPREGDDSSAAPSPLCNANSPGLQP